jgi:hypothetical protein
MDYGPDWPPAPTEAKRKRRTLPQRLVAWTAFYLALWVAAALILQALVPTGKTLDFPAPPGHTTDVTSTLPPSPHHH